MTRTERWLPLRVTFALLCAGLRFDPALAAAAETMTPRAPNVAQAKAIDDYLAEMLSKANKGERPARA